MPRRIVLLISFATWLLMASATLTDSKHAPTDVIGKRFKVVMENKVQYVGVITQFNEKSVVLADVSIIGPAERGVPFLSNIPRVNRQFKNVGLTSEKKLEYSFTARNKSAPSHHHGHALSAASPAAEDSSGTRSQSQWRALHCRVCCGPESGPRPRVPMALNRVHFIFLRVDMFLIFWNIIGICC